MKERTISFSPAMVRANAAGLKSQTRRTLKDQSHYEDWTCATRTLDSEYLRSQLPGADENSWVLQAHPGPLVDGKWQPVGCPYGTPGDLLLVKEAAWMWCERRPNGITPTGRAKWHYVPLESAPIHYTAEHPQKPTINVVSPDTGNQWGWRLKIGRFLPRYACRTTLKIVSVRLEHLQEIGFHDAVYEGLKMDPSGRYTIEGFSNYKGSNDPVDVYQVLWESINGEGSWDENPWVWVINYKIVGAAK